MGMSAGSGKGIRSEINVTPLVDVVLVLLIIFMVVTPLLEKEMAVRIPEIEPQDTPPSEIPPDQVVVQMKSGRLYLNSNEIQKEELGDKLTQLNQSRAEKIVFFDAEDSANYGEAVSVLDIVKKSGTDIIGMMMPDPSQPATPGAETPPPTPAPN